MKDNLVSYRRFVVSFFLFFFFRFFLSFQNKVVFALKMFHLCSEVVSP